MPNSSPRETGSHDEIPANLASDNWATGDARNKFISQPTVGLRVVGE